MTPKSILDFPPDKVLRERLKATLPGVMERAIMDSALSKRAKQSLMTSLKVKVLKDAVVITSNHPGFKALVEGQREGPMKWLRNADAPIPIVLDSGEVIFRTATAKSMRDGSWVHPGRKSSGILAKVKKESIKHVKQTLLNALKGKTST